MEKFNIAIVGPMYGQTLKLSKAIFEASEKKINLMRLNLVEYVEYLNQHKSSEIIESLGEDRYLELETSAVKSASGFEGAILETTPTFALKKNNFELLKKSYQTFGLIAKREDILENLKTAGIPLGDVAVKDIMAMQSKILTNVNELADFVVDVTGLSTINIMDIIFDKINKIKGYNSYDI